MAATEKAPAIMPFSEAAEDRIEAIPRSNPVLSSDARALISAVAIVHLLPRFV